MAKTPQGARADQTNDAPIEGEVVQSTERALEAMSNTGAASIDSSMVAILTRAELDQMVVTARANPRSIHLALAATREIATLNLQTATECGYALPRGRDDQTGKANTITGPSVRLAEIVACQWGNCQAASRVTDVNRSEGWVEAEGIFIDFQTNYRVTARVRRSIRSKPYQGKPGKVFSDDMINVTSNAAAAIAFRNAVFKGVPKPIWNDAYEATQKIVRGDEKSLGARRVDLLQAFKENLKIEPAKVYAILGVAGEKDIGLDELVVAAGFYAALKNNEVTVDDLLKQITPSGQAKTLAGAYDGAGAPVAQDTAKKPPAAEKPATATATDDEGKPSGEQVDQKTGEVSPAAEVLAGAAPAGVVHFLETAPDLNGEGKRATFKDGAIFSSALPTKDLPVYAELPAKAEEPQAEEAAAEAEAEDEEEEEKEGEPDVFVSYRETLSGLESWADVYKTLMALRATRAYQEADERVQVGLRVDAREVVEVLRETGKDPVDPRTDPAYYLLWLDGAEPRQVQPMWATFFRSEAYKALPDQQKDALAEATEHAKGTL
jgi:hypothetical protein